MRRNQVLHHKLPEGTHQKTGTDGQFHKITWATIQPLPGAVCISKDTFVRRILLRAVQTPFQPNPLYFPAVCGVCEQDLPNHHGPKVAYTITSCGKHDSQPSDPIKNSEFLNRFLIFFQDFKNENYIIFETLVQYSKKTDNSKVLKESIPFFYIIDSLLQYKQEP